MADEQGDVHVIPVQGAVGAAVLGMLVPVPKVEAGTGAEDQIAAAGGLEELKELDRAVGTVGLEGVGQDFVRRRQSGQIAAAEGVDSLGTIFDLRVDLADGGFPVRPDDAHAVGRMAMGDEVNGRGGGQLAHQLV